MTDQNDAGWSATAPPPTPWSGDVITGRKESPYAGLLMSGSARRWVVTLILGVLCIVAGWRYIGLGPFNPHAWIQDQGWSGRMLFVCFYAGAVTLLVPGSLLNFAAGALFGPWLGTLLSLVGAGIGSGTAFLIARHLAGDRVARRVPGMIGQAMAGIEAEGWRFVALVRLLPIFPFNVFNYAFGLTRIRFGPFLLTSVVGMIPGGLAHAWLGHAGSAAASGDARATVQGGLWALGLLAATLLVPRLLKRRHQHPDRKKQAGGPSDSTNISTTRSRPATPGLPTPLP
ncbi:MAG: TVP38/TMEM64 family protein [Magnetococcales bacterium]|nr:TVP38/TMEM64 family protein [Magnetococcales bacterium]